MSLEILRLPQAIDLPAEAGGKKLGYLLGDLVFISHPEVVGPIYNVALLWFGEVFNILLKSRQRNDKIMVSNNHEFGSGIVL